MTKRLFCLVACLLGLSFVGFAQIETETEQAAYLQENGKIQEAISIYKDLVKRYQSEQTYLLLCDALIKANQYEDAESYLKKAVTKYPDQIKFHVELFLLYEKEKEIKKAEKLFSKMLKELPANNTEIMNMGNAFFDNRHFEQAKQVFLRGRELLGNPTLYSWQLGSIYMQEKNYKAIAREYLLQLEKNPKLLANIEANMAGLLTKGEPELAEEIENEWKKISSSNPDNPYFAQFGIWLYSQTGKLDKAFEMAGQVDKKFEDNNGISMFGLAEDLSNAKYFRQAEKALEYMIAKGQTNAFYERSRILYAQTVYERFVSENDRTDKETNKVKDILYSTLEQFGYTRQTFDLIVSLADILANHASDAQSAVDMLERVQNDRSFSSEQRGELKLISAEIYHRNGDSWQASLFCSQVEKECKNGPVADKAKFFKAVLSYYKGEMEWALSQFKALRSSTSKLISNDAMEYSVLIQENMDEDSSFSALQLFALAGQEFDYGNYTGAESYLDSIEERYFYHSLFDEVLLFRAEIAMRQQNYASADSLLNELLMKYPYDLTADDAIMYLAFISEEYYKDKEKARQYYQRIILDYPNSLYATRAREMYSRLSKSNI